MPAQLTPSECQRVDAIVRGQKGSPAEALVAINKGRERRGVDPASHNTVARYCKGQTHRRDAAEARGRPLALTRAQIRSADAARKRLLKRVDNQLHVAWSMVIEEAGLQDAGCPRTICDTLRRELGVRYRPARKKIGHWTRLGPDPNALGGQLAHGAPPGSTRDRARAMVGTTAGAPGLELSQGYTPTCRTLFQAHTRRTPRLARVAPLECPRSIHATPMRRPCDAHATPMRRPCDAYF